MTLVIPDVSEFQGVVDWTKLGASNPAAIIRAHNGYRADNYWLQNRAQSRIHGQWRGFYQYLPAAADPVQAARDFQATTGPMQPGEVAILDIEEGSGDQRARRAAWLATLQDPIEWTYSGLAFARARLPGVKVEWLAAYGQGEPTDSHTLWQFTSGQRFPGISGGCDASTFHGTLADLQALTNTPEVDMPLTDADAVLVATAVWNRFQVHAPDGNITLQSALSRLLAANDTTALVAAIVAALPPTAGGAGLSLADVHTAVTDVLNGVTLKAVVTP